MVRPKRTARERTRIVHPNEAGLTSSDEENSVKRIKKQHKKAPVSESEHEQVIRNIKKPKSTPERIPPIPASTPFHAVRKSQLEWNMSNIEHENNEIKPDKPAEPAPVRAGSEIKVLSNITVKKPDQNKRKKSLKSSKTTKKTEKQSANHANTPEVIKNPLIVSQSNINTYNSNKSRHRRISNVANEKSEKINAKIPKKTPIVDADIHERLKRLEKKLSRIERQPRRKSKASRAPIDDFDVYDYQPPATVEISNTPQVINNNHKPLDTSWNRKVQSLLGDMEVEEVVTNSVKHKMPILGLSENKMDVDVKNKSPVKVATTETKENEKSRKSTGRELFPVNSNTSVSGKKREPLMFLQDILNQAERPTPVPAPRKLLSKKSSNTPQVVDKVFVPVEIEEVRQLDIHMQEKPEEIINNELPASPRIQEVSIPRVSTRRTRSSRLSGAKSTPAKVKTRNSVDKSKPAEDLGVVEVQVETIPQIDVELQDKVEAVEEPVKDNNVEAITEVEAVIPPSKQKKMPKISKQNKQTKKPVKRKSPDTSQSESSKKKAESTKNSFHMSTVTNIQPRVVGTSRYGRTLKSCNLVIPEFIDYQILKPQKAKKEKKKRERKNKIQEEEAPAVNKSIVIPPVPSVNTPQKENSSEMTKLFLEFSDYVEVEKNNDFSLSIGEHFNHVHSSILRIYPGGSFTETNNYVTRVALVIAGEGEFTQEDITVPVQKMESTFLLKQNCLTKLRNTHHKNNLEVYLVQVLETNHLPRTHANIQDTIQYVAFNR